jgi:hypothetical protein
MGEKESEADAKTQLAVLAVILLFFVKYFSGIFKGVSYQTHICD